MEIARRDIDVDEDDGDVVGGALVETLLDQAVRGGLGAGDRRKHRGDLVLGDVAAQAVGADDPAIAGLGLHDGRIDLGRRIDVTEHPHENRAPGMHGRFFCCDAAAVDQPLHEGVVVGDLGEFAVTEQVDAGVADVRDRHVVVDAEQAAHGRTHAGEFAVLENRLGEQGVRGKKRRLQRELGIVG